jgi:hypothetical protein
VTDDLLSSATDALRETPVDADGSATRLRVRRSLEATHRGRRQLAGFLTGTGILFAGTMSWAFATGRAEAVWRAIVDPAPVHEARVEPPAPAPTPAPAPAPRVPRHHATPEVPVQEPPLPAPPPVEAPAQPPAPAPAPPPRVEAPSSRAATGRSGQEAGPPGSVTRGRPVEALYRRAHELHFRGADHAAALAAWEAYLAAEPMGRFVAEARYNRALLLIRLGRYAEARAALAPYARGEIAGGYRRAEATRLIERLPERGLND